MRSSSEGLTVVTSFFPALMNIRDAEFLDQEESETTAPRYVQLCSLKEPGMTSVTQDQADESLFLA